MLVVLGEADGLAVVEFHIVFQHIGYQTCHEGPQFLRLGVGVQHLDLVPAELFQAIGITAQAALAFIEAEPDSVEDGQYVLLHYIRKAFVEPGLEYYAAGIDVGGVFWRQQAEGTLT